MTEKNTDLLTMAANQDNTVWTPTMILRWQYRSIGFDMINSQKVLQQLWKNDKGEEQYRDIPTEK